MNLKIHNHRSHTGKIGRLPVDIRNQIGRALRDGLPGVRIVAWLNSLPEVQTMLKQDFGGQPIKHQNLSKWKVHGYPAWLSEQAFMQGLMEFSAQQLQKMGLDAAPQTPSTVTGQAK
jgi:hypothetical protein